MKDAPKLTRQQRRALERRAGKMPIGMRQSDWHRLKGFARIKGRNA